MLAKRVIPTVLVRGKTAYKGPGFGGHCTRSVGSALSICRTHAMRGVDELLILDIGATAENRGPDLELVRQLSDGCFIPITVGGGVKTLDDIDALLRAGADKVAIGTAVDLIEPAADRFGRQAIVQIASVKRTSECARELTIHPMAGEVVMQTPELEGTMRGYDSVWEMGDFDGPVIVSCGCSGPEDMLKAVRAGADGVAAGALFQFTDVTPKDCARYLKANGVEVRL